MLNKRQTNILIVEDDEPLNQQLTDLLLSKGYCVDQSYDGEDGLIRAASGLYQLILLDVMLPKRDGISLLKMLRKSCQTPVIMVTAKGAEQEKIVGFSEGADDYVAKPFNTTELLFRIDAILRRSLPHESENDIQQLSLGNLTIDFKGKLAKVDKEHIELTPIQFKLLWELMLHQGEVLSKAYLYQRVLNRTLGAYDRSLDMHLSRVRKKLNEVHGPGDRLITSHGRGYCLI